MDAPLVAVRALHIGACTLFTGEFAFALTIARAHGLARVPGLARHVRIVAMLAMLAAFASGALWIVLEAASMSGTTIARAVADGAIPVVLGQTSFGHVFALRAAVMLAMIGVLVWLAFAGHEPALRGPHITALVLGGSLLATLAFVGHAAATDHGPIHAMHQAADMLHLLAAGGWVGALPAFVFCLARPLPVRDLARLTLRFSTLGLVCVLVLFTSGVVNAFFLVGSFRALADSPYGRLLLAKLAIFAVMLGLATLNRWGLTPRLLARNVAAAAALRRSATIEIVLGVAVIVLVGALGVTPPANHALHAGHGG